MGLVKYETKKNSRDKTLCLTICKVMNTDIKIGSLACKTCTHYVNINIEQKTVNCKVQGINQPNTFNIMDIL